MRFLATQAREPVLHYEHKEIGYNYRLSNICAGIGRGQLESLEGKLLRRKIIFERYKAAFAGLPLRMMPKPGYSEPNHWLSVFTINPGSSALPADIIISLRQERIETRPIWMPMNLQPVYRDCKFFSALPAGSVGEELFTSGVCLPSGSKMSEVEQDRVISAVLACFGKKPE